MKINSKVAAVLIGMAFTGSAVYAQSLDDAKKAITAEQYQKAKTMLKNLTVTEASKDENYFYLGWVYLKQDEPDSAKMWFNKGLAVNPKSALNYAGLGAVAHLDKDAAGVSSNFGQALSLAPKKDSKPYLYIGKGYLLTANGGAVSPADAQAAIGVLNKGAAVNPKDEEILIARGDAEASQLKSNEAYADYTGALAINPKSAIADVQLGVILKLANNYEYAEGDFKTALAIDPNFGPAYREWAETDARWAKNEPKTALEKDNNAIDEYKKYLSLTDMSLESQMHYADFLITAGKYAELEALTKQLSASASTNLRVYRYLAYAAYENKDYAAGLAAMNTWLTKADPKRVIPRDYLYLGRLQIANGSDSLGVKSLRKAYELDSTQADVFQEIAKSDYKQGKYADAADADKIYIAKSNKATLNDYLTEALSYYKEFTTQYYSKATPKPTPDTSLLTKADTAFSYVQHKASAPVAIVALYQAREQDFKETDRNTIKGLAKPYYEQYIALATAKGLKDSDKPFLAEAYDYLGRYYDLVAKDTVKATDAYSKALANDPADAGALEYNKRKGK
jgi:tetratricopeptide (TPR) repeat protein